MNKLSRGYLQTEIDGEKTYIKEKSLDKIRKVDAIIFDCDGVLIDIRESYNRAISETVAYITKELIGPRFPEDLVSREVIYLFKKSGGFNNDWDSAYAILMLILCKLPEDFQEAFKKYANMSQREDEMLKRFLLVKNGIRKEYNSKGLDSVMPTLEDMLRRFAVTFDDFGIASMERKLMKLPNTSKSFYEFYDAAKGFLSYPGKVGESVLTTVFEEIFCGSQLFKEIYGKEPRLYQGRGLIENEKLIIRPETLEQLAFILGRASFGIASGRPSKLAKHTLRGLLDRFNPKALVFLDDFEAAEREAMRDKGLRVNFNKPNPFSLLRSSEGLEPFMSALYVGDSMEDEIMVKEANKEDSRFLFAGVYDYSDCEEEVVHDFLKAAVEVILPSVNELPTVLKAIKGGEMP